MADMRRTSPEPPPGPPRIEYQPGMAKQTLAELGPLLAQEGIDVDNLEVDDLQTLQDALNRSMEQRNMMLFTPVGAARGLQADTLRQVVAAILSEDGAGAGRLLEGVVPDSPDQSQATVSGCIGIALSLLDEWLGRGEQSPPAGLAGRARPPRGHWNGKRAATDILALATKGRAFDAVGRLITRHGGQQVLAGATLALAGTLHAWGQATGDEPDDLADTLIA